MLTGLLFLGTITVVAYLMYWLMTNEKADGEVRPDGIFGWRKVIPQRRRRRRPPAAY